MTMTDSYGNINWWGFSPALDLQEIGLQEMCKKLVFALPDELHILLVGAGDIRYILKTVARRYRHTKRKLTFYVIESALELYARDMLLMKVALEKQKNMGLQDKTELFLELYGNSLVRQQSSQHVERMAHELIKMVTDFDYLEEKLPMFDLSQLKYKERDFLESILKFWRNREKIQFDISKCWDLRLRQLLGVRYDCRNNVFDWDYNMELIDRGASVVYIRQYKNWRDKGVAFEIREGTYDVPNRTLASGIVFKHDGERFPRRGYWGDMIVSPYITFGIETEEKSLYKKLNNQHIKTAEDISEYNITSLFFELATGQKYELPKGENKEEVKEIAVSEVSAEVTEDDAKRDRTIDDAATEKTDGNNKENCQTDQTEEHVAEVVNNEDQENTFKNKNEKTNGNNKENCQTGQTEEHVAEMVNNEDQKNKFKSKNENRSEQGFPLEENDKSEHDHLIEENDKTEHGHPLKEKDKSEHSHLIEEKDKSENGHPMDEKDKAENGHPMEEKDKSENREHVEEKDKAVEFISLDDVKIIFLPLVSVPELIKKNKYHKLFNVVFFSNSMVHHLKPEVSQLFADKCSLILETALFMLALKKENVKDFVNKISGMAEAAGCKPLETCDELQDSYIKFYFERFKAWHDSKYYLMSSMLRKIKMFLD